MICDLVSNCAQAIGPPDSVVLYAALLLSSPGSLPAQFMIESMMEHVAKVLNKDPSEVRKINFYTKGQVLAAGMVRLGSWHGSYSSVSAHHCV